MNRLEDLFRRVEESEGFTEGLSDSSRIRELMLKIEDLERERRSHVRHIGDLMRGKILLQKKIDFFRRLARLKGEEEEG